MKTSKKHFKSAIHNKKLRYWICKKSIYMFAIYYFKHYFFAPSAEFHKEMAEDLLFKGHRFLMWIMFRESAKTVWAKIKVTHAICYGYKKNIAWVAYDAKKADKQIMSIASELKGNARIIRDFGQLYFESDDTKHKKSKMKRLGDFETTNGVSVRATSIMIPTRGDIADQYRPDFYVIDDIENMKTARSLAITKTVIENIGELIGGMAVDCDTLFLGNKIALNGSVSKIEKKLDSNPMAIIHEVAILDKKGNITWPSRFVKTDKEAEKLNRKILNARRKYRSLQQMKKDQGTNEFNREMMLKPMDSAGSPIKMEWVKFEPLPTMDRMDKRVAVDPAISQKQTADYFAMAAGGRHYETGKIHVFRSHKTRCRVNEQVNLVTNWHRGMPDATFIIETVAYQQALYQLLEDKRKENIYINVKNFKPNGDKIFRMNAIAPYIERGDVVFQDTPEVRNLVERICQFPFMDDGHDDDVDAFISLIEDFVITAAEPSLAIA